MKDLRKENILNSTPNKKSPFITYNPVEKQSHFSNLTEFKKHCFENYTWSEYTLSDHWLSDTATVINNIFRFSKQEIWLQSVNQRINGPIYKVYAYIVLLYSSYGVRPDRQALINDIFDYFEYPKKCWSEMIQYKKVREKELIRPESRAICTLWDDINIFFKPSINPRIMKIKLLMPIPKFKMFYALTHIHEKDLLAGKQITSSEPAEKWLRQMSELREILK